MIPNFKTFLKESLWADVQKQASGEVVKKEDDVDSLNYDMFADYIRTHYTLDGFNLGTFHSNETTLGKKYYKVHYDWIAVPLCQDYGDTYDAVALVLNYVNGEMYVTTDSIMEYEFEKIKDIYSVFDIKKETRDYDIFVSSFLNPWPDVVFMAADSIFMKGKESCIRISPKDGKECTNSFFLEVLDYLIDNLKRKTYVEKK